MKDTIDELLDVAVARGDVPNVVAVVADRDGLLYEGAAGPRVAGGSDKVGLDTSYRLASMTKMITTAGVLKLVDDGSVDLDAPVAEYRPEFDHLMVLERMDDDTPVLREPKSRATVRQLATHTSGLSYWFFSDAIVRWEEATGTPGLLTGLAGYLDSPMIVDPGTKPVYGHSTDWLGLVAEAVSGKTLDQYLDDALLGPLEMTSTSFRMSDSQRADLVPVHAPTEDGGWIATDVELPVEPDWWPGGHGLYSTPRDYVRFQRMLLRGGELDGVRHLSPGIVGSAFSPQIGGLFIDEVMMSASPMHTCDFAVGPGRTWGLGLMLNTKQEPGMRAPYSGAWAGLFNSHFWIDPTSGVTAALYSQFLPFVTPASMAFFEDFERAVYADR